MTTTNSVTLHRVIKAAPEKVFRAFADGDIKASWLPPYGFVCTVQEHNFKVGGSYKMTFITFTTGNKQSFGGTYTDIKPNESIRYTDVFDDKNLPGKMDTTITFKKVIGGTDLTVVQSDIPAMIPTSMCYLGWQDSLDKLTKLVEPEIQD